MTCGFPFYDVERLQLMIENIQIVNWKWSSGFYFSVRFWKIDKIHFWCAMCKKVHNQYNVVYDSCFNCWLANGIADNWIYASVLFEFLLIVICLWKWMCLKFACPYETNIWLLLDSCFHITILVSFDKMKCNKLQTTQNHSFSNCIWPIVCWAW